MFPAHGCFGALESRLGRAGRNAENNHPDTWADCQSIKRVEPARIRGELGLNRGELEVLVGGPPCQGSSIDAPDRFFFDPRNKLFRDYVRFAAAEGL